MDYIDKFILDTWKKIPKSFKDRVNNLELITKSKNERAPYLTGRMIEISKDNFDNYQIVVYTNVLKQKFQKEINKLIISELASVFGFDEDEAYELMSKK